MLKMEWIVEVVMPVTLDLVIKKVWSQDLSPLVFYTTHKYQQNHLQSKQ